MGRGLSQKKITELKQKNDCWPKTTRKQQNSDYQITVARCDATVNTKNYTVESRFKIFVINILETTFTNPIVTNRYTKTSFTFCMYAFWNLNNCNETMRLHSHTRQTMQWIFQDARPFHLYCLFFIFSTRFCPATIFVYTNMYFCKHIHDSFISW